MWQNAIKTLQQQQAEFDKNTADWLPGYETGERRIYCRRGCSNCCNLAVNATFTEALAIAKRINKDQRESLKVHVDRLIELRERITDLKSYLKLHRQQVGFCPFLTPDGVCGIYAYRPFSCRSLLSTRDEAWCGVDFSTLHQLERKAFLSSLDPQVVAFPSHYVAATQELGRKYEEQTTEVMVTRFDVAVTGNLPFLVWLELNHNLSLTIPQGAAAIDKLLKKKKLAHSWLIQVF